MGENISDSTQADFRIPDENEFEQLPPPELSEGLKEHKSVNPETGELLHHTVTDVEGRTMYQRERTFSQDNPQQLNSDWQRFELGFDDKNRVTERRVQKLVPGNESQSYEQHAYDDETGGHTVTGRIEAGKDAGHEWRTSRTVLQDFNDGRQIIQEKNEILEQGQNPAKPQKETSSTKQIYMKSGKWLGEEWTDDHTGQTAVNLPAGAESLPDWRE
ncbi:MAG: hypothetical protein WC289_04240 [Patescibacteria group bacterium]|jgi:hypothetical protein